ncbi:hypothetical protein [uncultured Psychroserpens sp.]|uniref:hypothetical protein n=1 Tax=uncultured Psychroserpens sp. TaxID=255436 RepID=UPI002623DC4D|nr:hypothetical protein [uncultured Psychroserpens sp.]
MKTIYRISIMALSLALFIVSCDRKKDKRSFDNIFKNHIISKEQGVNMFREFQRNRTKIIEPILQKKYGDPSFEDTKFVWLSLEDMKEYMAFLEAIQEENPKKEVSGLRVYFAAYPNERQYNGKTIKHPKQQTFFMIPTVNSGWADGNNVNVSHLPFVIEPDGKNRLKGKFKIVKELMLDYKKDGRYDFYNKRNGIQEGSFNMFKTLVPKYKETTNTLFNEGEMSPPPNGRG